MLLIKKLEIEKTKLFISISFFQKYMMSSYFIIVPLLFIGLVNGFPITDDEVSSFVSYNPD